MQKSVKHPSRSIVVLIGLLILSFLLSKGVNLYSQDNNLTTPDIPFTHGWLSDVTFIDNEIGWAVGYDIDIARAAILHSTDRGDEWSYQANPFQGTLNGVYFIDRTTGWAVGQTWPASQIAMVKTTDGGGEWEVQILPQLGGFLEKVAFVSPALGWAVGRDEDAQETLILRTEDGSTWMKSPHPTHNGLLNALFFVDTEKGWVVGTDQENDVPIILYTNDGGTHWDIQNHPVTTGWFQHVMFNNDQTGWISGRSDVTPVLLKTTNGGTTWDINPAPDVSEYLEDLPKSHLDNTNEDISSSSKVVRMVTIGLFIVALILIFTAAATSCVLFSSSDSGLSWLPMMAMLVAAIYSMAPIVGNHIIGVGENELTPVIIKAAVPTTEVDITTNDMPGNFQLFQNYPNPFNPETIIRFDVKEPCRVVLKIYDILGREVRTLVEGDHPPGSYRVDFDTHELSAGVYFYCIQMKDFIDMKKMILLE